ncbi:papilin isoform X1 [Pelobates cultripes]|nr:papilin isoform X1 [Pelobates cultripes]
MKIPLLLVVFTLLLLLESPVSARKTKRQSDFWDNWGIWGECSRSCGGGVSFRERQCYSRRADGGSNCIGPTRNYRSCNVQDCPEGSRDFRALQCSEYDGMEFQGKRHKWLPYYGASNKCELNCIPKGENFYYRHKMAVLDGTPCEPGRRDICVEGVCKSVGCDNVLDSSKREDKCLVCGGDGTSCYDVKGVYDTPTLSKGYSQLFTIPKGATNIQIKEVGATRNFLAVKNARGEYYLNGYWTIEYSRAMHVASTVLHYYRGSEGDQAPEVLTARGPTTEPLVIELIGQETNQGVQYEYYLPNQGETEDYQWSYGSWSECSAECGGGYQSRLVFCTIDNEAYPDVMCRDLRAPPSNRTCSMQPCPQMKRMSYVYQPALWSRIVNTKMTSWKISEWSQCSASCGGGAQTRSVYCVSYEGRSSQQVVSDAECAAFTEKPPTQQACNIRACATWNVGPWTECSSECGEGIQKRTVTCRTDTGVVVQDLMCMTQVKPTDSQLCNGENCVQEIGWHIGEWGLCSKSCNHGIRKRQVICADNDRNFYEPETCKSYEPEMPTLIENCNMQPCYLPQQVPSMQDTWGYDNSDQFSLTRYNQEAPKPQKPVPEQPSRDNGPRDCRQSEFGCCSDGYIPASGPGRQGCPVLTCQQTRYGCCPDGLMEAKGPDYEGCNQNNGGGNPGRNERADPAPPPPPAPSDECRLSKYGCCFDNNLQASGPMGEGCPNKPSHSYPPMCMLPSAMGTCSDWTTRWYFVPDVGKCNRFWFGGCHGNSNNFAAEEECMSSCQKNSRRPTGTIEYRYRRRGMKWDRMSHVHPDGHEEGPNGNEHEGYPQQIVRTLDEDHEGRNLAGHDAWSEHGKRVHGNGKTRQRTNHGSSSSSRHSSIHRIILDKVESSAMEASSGQTIRLLCRVSDYPFPKVEWTKDGNPVSSSRHTYQSDSSLVITHVRPEDTGVYKCTVSNGNRMETHRVHLQVRERAMYGAPQNVSEGNSGRVLNEDIRKPDSAAQTLRGSSCGHKISSGRRALTPNIVVVEANLGHRTRLSCHMGLSNSTLVEWQKDGKTLSSPRHRKQTDGSLAVSRVSSDDAGLYTCFITNGADHKTKQIQLIVRGELKITGPPSSITVTEGDKAALQCIVKGDNVNVKWSRNGIPVQSDGDHTVVSQDGSLIIRNTRSTDEGSYTCNAYSGTHSVSASADIRVSKSKAQASAVVGTDLSNECIDHPDLANCDLIVYAQLCSNEYYGSFCCASCSSHRPENSPVLRHS